MTGDWVSTPKDTSVFIPFWDILAPDTDISLSMTVTIETLAQLAEFQAAPGLGKLVFRGQGNASWGLVPSMYRGMNSLDLDGWETSINDRERDIFREFSDKSRRLWDGGSPWDTLVMAQHYGTPTRLLDWTPNAQAALFFACASMSASDGAIWYARPTNLPMPSGIGRIHDELGFRKERLAGYIREMRLPFCVPFSEAVPSVTSSSPPPPAPPAFDQSGDPDFSGILTFFIPAHINDRVAAQIGLFSVYICEYSAGEIVADHNVYLQTVERHFNTHILDKLIIPAPAKESLLADLERVGVNARSIYPDLHGLGLYLGQRQRHLVEEITLSSIPTRRTP